MDSIPDIFKTLTSPGVCDWWCFEALMSVAHWLVIFSSFLRHDVLWEQLSCGWGQSSHTQSRNQPASHNTHHSLSANVAKQRCRESPGCSVFFGPVAGRQMFWEKNGTDLIFYIDLFVYYSSLLCVLLIRLFFAIVVWVSWFPEEWLLLAGFCLASFTVAASSLMCSWARSLRFVPCRVFASSAIIRQDMRHEGRKGGGQTSTVTPQPAPTSTNHLECYPPVPVSWND